MWQEGDAQSPMSLVLVVFSVVDEASKYDLRNKILKKLNYFLTS